MAITSIHDRTPHRHRKHSWHRWFAWRPVQYTGSKQWVWLEVVYRRALYKTYGTYDDWQKWEYGTAFDILRSPPEPGKQR